MDPFFDLVGSEPERVVSAKVRILTVEGLTKVRSGMPVLELLSLPAVVEDQTLRYRHVLGEPASPEQIAKWLQLHPTYPLPVDLVALLERINGIHLWASVETGLSYEGLAPIEEWKLAHEQFSIGVGELDERYIALSYHQDGACYIVLDLLSGAYFQMDSAAPDPRVSSVVAENVEGLLQWLWSQRMAP